MAGKFWFERSGHHSIQTNNCTTIVQLTRNRFSSHFTYVRLKTSTSLQGKQQSQQYKNSRENFYCFKNVYLQRNSNLIKFYWNFFFGYSNGKCFPTKEKKFVQFFYRAKSCIFSLCNFIIFDLVNTGYQFYNADHLPLTHTTPLATPKCYAYWTQKKG